LRAQGGQLGHAADVALAAGGDAVAHPVFLAHDLAGQLVLGGFFLGQHLVAPGFVVGKTAVQALGAAAV
jgi:hypothetical protein